MSEQLDLTAIEARQKEHAEKWASTGLDFSDVREMLTDTPALIAEVRRLRAKNAALREDAALGRLVRETLPAQRVSDEFAAVGLLYMPECNEWVVARCSTDDIECSLDIGGTPTPEEALRAVQP